MKSSEVLSGRWKTVPAHAAVAYEGDVHPVTGDRVFRQDAAGYRAAYRDILRSTPRHPALRDAELWKGRMNGAG